MSYEMVRAPNPFFAPPALQYVSMGHRRPAIRLANPGDLATCRSCWERPATATETLCHVCAANLCPCGCGGRVGSRDDRSWGPWFCPVCGDESDRGMEQPCSLCAPRLPNPFFAPPALQYVSMGHRRPAIRLANPMTMFGADRPFVVGPGPFKNPRPSFGATAYSTFGWRCDLCGTPTSSGATRCYGCRGPQSFANPPESPRLAEIMLGLPQHHFLRVYERAISNLTAEIKDLEGAYAAELEHERRAAIVGRGPGMASGERRFHLSATIHALKKERDDLMEARRVAVYRNPMISVGGVAPGFQVNTDYGEWANASNAQFAAYKAAMNEALPIPDRYTYAMRAYLLANMFDPADPQTQHDVTSSHRVLSEIRSLFRETPHGWDGAIRSGAEILNYTDPPFFAFQQEWLPTASSGLLHRGKELGNPGGHWECPICTRPSRTGLRICESCHYHATALDNPSKRCTAGAHSYDPLTRACKRRGCSARLDEPGQTYLLAGAAPAIVPDVGPQRTMFGYDESAEAAHRRELARREAERLREDPGQAAFWLEEQGVQRFPFCTRCRTFVSGECPQHPGATSIEMRPRSNPGTLEESAEAWARGLGLRVPPRGSPAWKGMYQAWLRMGLGRAANPSYTARDLRQYEGAMRAERELRASERRGRKGRRRKKGLTAAKARKILRDGTVHGRPLTKKQKRFFGAIAGGAKLRGKRKAKKLGLGRRRRKIGKAYARKRGRRR